MCKRIFRLLAPVLLLIAFSVPAFAAETRYTPKLPPFVSGSAGNYAITVPYDKESSSAVTDFFKGFESGPHLVVVDQQAKTGDDLKWWLIFVKPHDLSAMTLGVFTYSDPLSYPDTASHPIKLASNSGFDICFYVYDYANKQFNRGSVQKSTGYFQFSYVIGSSPLSNPATFYPGYRTLAKKYHFTTGPAAYNGIEKHYNWWLSTKTVQEEFPPESDINIDTDGDGKPDVNIDTDGDGKPDINIDTDGDRKPDLNIDTNGDGKPDVNVDTDGDGRPDINIDTNGDRKPDINIDTNGDKKPDLNIDTNGDRQPDVNVDTNGDGKPDINIDTDGDGKPDINIDTNGDKKPDINIDTNGDKKPDLNVDTNGDGKPDVNIDTDGDGKPDKDIDADGDGKPDSGGTSSGGSGGGAGGGHQGGEWDDPDYGDDWFSPDDKDYPYNDFPIFDPWAYDYEPYDYSTGSPWTEYDPLQGYEAPTMPQIPSGPLQYDFSDPFYPWGEYYQNQRGG